MIPGIDAVGQRPDGKRVYFMAAAAAEFDIVLDYVWGKPAQQAIIALLTARSDRSRAMNWIQIGAGTIAVNANPVPLAGVTQAWTRGEVPGERTVLVP